MAAVDRSQFEAAEALKDQKFKAVVLAYRGRARFLLEGEHFREIGQERAWQYPIYRVRILPPLVFSAKTHGTTAQNRRSSLGPLSGNSTN
jgi:hypothetical protein